MEQVETAGAAATAPPPGEHQGMGSRGGVSGQELTVTYGCPMLETPFTLTEKTPVSTWMGKYSKQSMRG